MADAKGSALPAGGALAGTEKIFGLHDGVNKTWLASHLATYITALISGSAPATLDTLNKLAAALGNDPNFAATITAALAGKQPLDGDLTAIAALSTTPYGRALLALADQAALQAYIGLGTSALVNTGVSGHVLGYLDGANIWSNNQIIEVPSASTTLTVRSDSNAIVRVERYVAANSAPALFLTKARGTIASPASIVQNDLVCQMQGLGYSSGAARAAFVLQATVVAASPSSTDMESAFQIRLAAAGSASVSTNFLDGSFASGLSVAGEVYSSTDNLKSLGKAANRWSVVYAGTGAINTSDEREKRDIQPMSATLLDAWAAVEWKAFRFNDAYARKGEDARWHFGAIAQHVRAAIDGVLGEGTALRLGLVCHDQWDAREAVWGQDTDEDGEPIGEPFIATPAQAAGDRWGLRYEECFAVEAAYQRRRMALIEARLAALEQA